ncbi:putative 13.7kDa protein [Pigeonpox virus]|uniref:Putative 13.7kDa protein n=1 Tax=Pigeonpox virus TaxID=10264 RepID=A0A068EH85_9POXV|nr:putative 13.7kDa protein [Pigeonpox virus]AID46718.1 putative 13.7kDa protein [Pigeonpox virus]
MYIYAILTSIILLVKGYVIDHNNGVCNNITVIKDINMSNSTFDRLLCTVYMKSEDGYIYWIGPNSTFIENLEGAKEGSDDTLEVGDNCYRHTRELNITSRDYLGKNFTCTSMTDYGTTFFKIVPY